MYLSAASGRAGELHFDAADVRVDERAEFIREAVSNGVSPVEVEHLLDARQAMDMRLDGKVLGALTVHSMRFSAMVARRTSRLARDDSPDSLFVVAKRAGSSSVVQDGREAVVEAGSLFLLHSTKPSLLRSDQHSYQDVIRIPVQDLALPEQVLRQALALRLGPELPIAGVLGRFIDSLTSVTDVQPVDAQYLARAAVDLVRGLVTTVQSDSRPPAPARDALDATLTLRVIDFLRMHWREHDLTADRVASAHHISRRQLYRLLAAQDISLGDWVREQRLDASRNELSQAGAGADTIAAVGRRWGFSDPTNFGRAFKASYGQSPLEWRQSHRPTQP